MPKEAAVKRKKSAPRSGKSTATRTQRKKDGLETEQEPTEQSVQEFKQALSRLIAEEPNSVRWLWGTFDDQMRHLLAVTIGFHIGRWSEEQVWYAKTQRGLLLRRSLNRQIQVLEKTYLERALFEREEIPDWKSVFLLGRPRSYSLSENLRYEIAALKELLSVAGAVFGLRRLGTNRMLDLVLLEQYVLAWTARRGREQTLTMANMADLIDLGKRADGRAELSVTNVDTLSRTLLRFKQNKKNLALFNSAKLHAWRRFNSK